MKLESLAKKHEYLFTELDQTLKQMDEVQGIYLESTLKMYDYAIEDLKKYGTVKDGKFSPDLLTRVSQISTKAVSLLVDPQENIHSYLKKKYGEEKKSKLLKASQIAWKAGLGYLAVVTAIKSPKRGAQLNGAYFAYSALDQRARDAKYCLQIVEQYKNRIQQYEEVILSRGCN